MTNKAINFRKSFHSPQIFLANFFLKYKAYELSGDVGWSTVKVVPGPGLKEMKLGVQKLLFKSLQRA
jgi:hypothetical protein